MEEITELSQLDLNATYSYADYLTWRLDGAVELIKGKIMAMSPAPNLKHQRISRNILRPIDNYLRHKTCEVFHAPFDVKLYNSKNSQLADLDVFTVVQPDLCVICEPEKLSEQGCNGAPDWIIEVLSPGNTKKEMRLKYDLYQENGVTEYWLVYPYEQAVYQFVLDQHIEKYQLFAMYAGDDLASPALLPELHIDLADVFAE